MGFQIGDLVWAKMKGYPLWPAQIVEKNEKVKEPKSKKPHQFVYFYGDKKFAWMSEEKILPHSDNILHTLSKKKTKAYQQAIDEFLDHIKTNMEKQSSKVKKSSESERKSTKVVQIIKSECSKERNLVGSEVQVKKVSRKRKSPSSKQMSPPSEKISPSSKRSRIFSSSSDSSLNSTSSISLPGCSFSNMDSENLDDIEKIFFKLKHLTQVGKDYRNISEMSTPSEDMNPPCEEMNLPFKMSRISNTGSDSSLKSTSNLNLPGCDFNGMDFDILDDIEKIGFMGLNELSTPVLVRLVEHGIDVTLLKSDIQACSELPVLDRVRILNTPAELVIKCDVVFSCYSIDSEDDASFKEVIFGESGILTGLDYSENLIIKPKGYIILHSVLEEFSKKINEAITIKNGCYLEAPMLGTIPEAVKGELIILASGHPKLFADCNEIFAIISKTCRFLSSEPGMSSKYSILLNTVNASVMEAALESMTFAERLNISKYHLMEVFKEMLKGDVLNKTNKRISDLDFREVIFTPLENVARKVNIAMRMSDRISHPLPLAATINEIFKWIKRMYCGEYDISVIGRLLGAPV